MSITDAMNLALAYDEIGINTSSKVEDMLAEGYTPEEAFMMLGLC